MKPAELIKGEKSQKLSGKKILVGVTGSVAAIESVKLIRELLRHSAEVIPVMSSEAMKIISPATIQFASGHKPVCEITGDCEYIHYTEEASAFLIAPCTANTIAKVSSGIQDTPITLFASVFIGRNKPLLIAPAMHEPMYKNSIIMECVKKLKSLRVIFIEPEISEGSAKLANIEAIVSWVIRSVSNQPLNKKKALVISGATVEQIDDIRYITTKSTGHTGISLAKELFERGADVNLWMGEQKVLSPIKMNLRRFRNVGELISMINETKQYEIVIVCAAISDFIPEKRKGKISSEKAITIHLKPSEKVIEKIRKHNNGYIVGFKLESGLIKENLINKAHKILLSSKLNMVIANDIKDILENKTRVYIIDRKGLRLEIEGNKETVAYHIVNEIVRDLT